MKLTQQLALNKQEPSHIGARKKCWQYKQYQSTTEEGKLKSPSAKDQAVGVNKSGPHKYSYEEDLIQLIHNASITAATN